MEPDRPTTGNRTTLSVLAARRKVDMRGKRKKKPSDLDAIIQRLRS